MSNRGDLLRVRARFKAAQAEQEPRLDRFFALMGNGEGDLAVSGSPLFVYVRVLGRGVVECLNQVAPLRNDLPLIVGYDFKKPDTLQVLSIYEGGITSFGPYAYLPAHHQAHEFRNVDGGDDVVWVQKQAVIPLLCRPTSPTTMFVEVLEDNYPWLGGWNLFPGATSADLTARIPALPGDARFVLVYVNGATNALLYRNGAIFPAAWPPGTAFSLVPVPLPGTVPVAAIYLPNGITAIDWDEIYDLRLFNQPVGGSVTPGPHALLDNAVHSDTVTNTPPAQGSIIVADAAPDWDELVHPGGAGYALTTDATDVIWDQTPAWTGAHTFNAGLIIGAGQGITLPDPGWIGFGPAAERLTIVTGVPDVAEFVGFGQLNIENVLGHIGDPDTYLIFAPDSIVLRAGGVDLVHVTTVGVDRVEINPNEDNVDFIVNSNALADTLLVDGATGAISVTGPSLTVPAAWNLIVPDNVADAFGLDDAGGLEYMRIVSTDANPYFLIDPAGAGIKVGIGGIPGSLLSLLATRPTFTLGSTDASDKGISLEYNEITEDLRFQARDRDGGTWVADLAVLKRDSGYVGIGTMVPSKLLHLVDGAGAEPAYDAGTMFIIQNNDDVADQARMVLLAGTSGYSVLTFADSGDADIGAIFYEHVNDRLYFRVNANTGMILDSTGVAIGSHAPSYPFDLRTNVAAAYMAYFFNDGGDGRHGLIVQCGEDLNPDEIFIKFLDGDGGNVGWVIGDGAGGVTYFSVSDERLKNVLGPIDPELAMRALVEVNPIQYVGRDLTVKTGHKNVGFSAQDMHKYFPEVATEDGISYERLVPVLWAQNQALLARLKELEKRE